MSLNGNKIEEVIKGLELAKSQAGKGKPVMNLMKNSDGLWRRLHDGFTQVARSITE